MESICLFLLPPSNDRCLPARAPALFFSAPSVVRIKLLHCRNELNEAQRRSTCSLHTGLSWEMTQQQPVPKWKAGPRSFWGRKWRPMRAVVSRSLSKQQQDDWEEFSDTMFVLWWTVPTAHQSPANSPQPSDVLEGIKRCSGTLCPMLFNSVGSKQTKVLIQLSSEPSLQSRHSLGWL